MNPTTAFHHCCPIFRPSGFGIARRWILNNDRYRSWRFGDFSMPWQLGFWVVTQLSGWYEQGNLSHSHRNMILGVTAILFWWCAEFGCGVNSYKDACFKRLKNVIPLPIWKTELQIAKGNFNSWDFPDLNNPRCPSLRRLWALGLTNNRFRSRKPKYCAPWISESLPSDL